MRKEDLYIKIKKERLGLDTRKAFKTYLKEVDRIYKKQGHRQVMEPRRDYDCGEIL